TEASPGFGGQEIRILVEARWLLDHGHAVLVAAQPGSRLLAEAGGAGVPATAVRMRGSLDAGAFVALRRLMRDRRVGLVHTHSSVDSWLAGLAGRSLGRAVVRSRHVSIPILRYRALVYRLAHRVIASGDAVAATVARGGVPAGRIVSIMPGVDTTRFHPGVSGAGVRAELGLGTAPVVGLVANIRGSKGHRFFLEAAREVLGAVPTARFLVVGDGVGYDDVRRRVRELGLEAAVHLTGFRRDVPEVMAALDVLVLPSVRSEATSQVVPQALAVGTPVVATRAGGLAEIVRDGETGRRVPPADPAALARAVLECLADPAGARAMARRGQARVHAEHGLDAVMARTLDAYAAARAAAGARAGELTI
ncbi:MAG TPA: glycosyltransferase, partial [Methylomirabilota bacterium]|nr:glycosyltransferase [Methylomirabilota bacterium]